MNRLLLALLPLTLTAPALAADPPGLVAPRLRTGDNITEAIARGYDERLRKTLKGKANVIAPDATEAAVKKAGIEAGCVTDACGAKLATAADTRFVLNARITNNDEIYEVSLSLYDHALTRRVEAKQVCELCAADEVGKSIDAAVAELAPALAVAAPAKPAEPVAAEDGKVPVEVITDPEGAEVAVGGKPAGQSPIVLRLELGTHELTFSKPEHAKVTRSIQVLGSPIKLNVKLEKVTLAAAPPPDATGSPTEVMAPVEPVSGFPYTATALGMLIGGVALGGVGTWLVFLDGEVTCDDGRGRTECPNVYDTKAVGVAGLGVGAALIGAGATILILDPGSNSGASVGPTDDGTGAAFHLRGQF